MIENLWLTLVEFLVGVLGEARHLARRVAVWAVTMTLLFGVPYGAAIYALATVCPDGSPVGREAGLAVLLAGAFTWWVWVRRVERFLDRLFPGEW